MTRELSHLSEQCRQLRSKAAMANPSVAMQQLCVVVERAFTEIVPASAWSRRWGPVRPHEHTLASRCVLVLHS